MINIEKGIPCPLGRKSKYPFVNLEVGDSLTTGKYSLPEYKRVYSAFSEYIKRHNLDWKFIIRDDKSNLRVWRTK